MFRARGGARAGSRTPISAVAGQRAAIAPRAHIVAVAFEIRKRRRRLGPCRTWAAGWLHGDPIGQSVLRSRIENRRFLKEIGRPDGTCTRIPRLERPGSWLLDDKAEDAQRTCVRGTTSSARTRPLRAKFIARPASPFDASVAHRAFKTAAHHHRCATEKNTHRRPFRPFDYAQGGLDGRRILCGRWLIGWAQR